MDVLDFIKNNHQNRRILCEQLFFIHGTYSFQNKLDKAHTIISAVSKKYNIPLSHIKVTGSAHLGVSLQKGTNFTERQSDLDLAIIDANLYADILNIIYLETNQYNDLSTFSEYEIEFNGENITTNNFEMYQKWLTKGVIHPKYFPNNTFKKGWDSFFYGLSRRNNDIFKSITACVYISENSFNNKQMPSIHKVLKSFKPVSSGTR